MTEHIYSKKVIEYFDNPQNSGKIEDADGIGIAGNPICGDVIKIYLKIEDNRIKDIKYKTFGCGAAIACSEAMVCLVKGRGIEDILPEGNTRDENIRKLKNEIIIHLGGLPLIKIHCSMLSTDGLYNALDDYYKKSGENDDTKH